MCYQEEEEEENQQKMDWENKRIFTVIHINIERELFVCRTTTAFVKHLVYKPIIGVVLIAH